MELSVVHSTTGTEHQNKVLKEEQKYHQEKKEQIEGEYCDNKTSTTPLPPQVSINIINNN